MEADQMSDTEKNIDSLIIIPELFGLRVKSLVFLQFSPMGVRIG